LASDVAALIPVEMGRQILQEAAASSVVLQLAARQTMTTGQTQIPVLAALPQASFIAAPGAPKPETAMEWSSLVIQAEEIAALLPLPRSYLDDSIFNIWGEVRPRLGEAVAKCLDNAVISGVGAPASFPAGGVLAYAGDPIQAAPSPEQPDLVQAISEAMVQIEDTGLDVTGFAARTSVRGHFRSLRSTSGEWLVWAPTTPGAPATMYGAPLVYSRIGFTPAGAADLIVGDWSALILGLREDMRFDISTEGVIRDPATGAVTVSAFQDDVAIMRVYMRAGAVIGRSVANRPDGSQGLGNPFAAVRVPGSPSGQSQVSAQVSSSGRNATARAS
jgi:HK97 family phage major capsid protein